MYIMYMYICTNTCIHIYAYIHTYTYMACLAYLRKNKAIYFYMATKNIIIINKLLTSN